ncbi:ABC transporter ATP-binding protein [Cellulosimicrobium arenosum]|uniref:ABC transporter ATP-binding protein n=1 Tax=Cellulosimicrobium arenosum TaxID=2708133 RepID=A0A927GB22_9MICO|nr:ABC transporter ATP-binding protein [Cellulosimicrobium arenosum]MBD8079430.1 ABC transporter ATP-binding protein [Cellulosimicrobium arenosum]
MSAGRHARGFERSELLVQARGVTRTYGDVRAVDDMSLEVAPGEIVGLLGANGAGKTTLLRVLLALEAADAGEVEVLGSAPAAVDRHALGYVPQGLGLYTDLSTDQNVEFVAQAYGVAEPPPLPDELAAVRTALVAEIGLGLQRRLAFYCALMHAPRLLVLDEPTSGVDPLARARLWDTIHEQAEAGVGVLVTTHYLQEAAQCTRLEIMSHGRRVAHGTVADITSGREAVVVRGDDWAAVFGALADAGLPVVLDGRTTRVAGTPAADVEAALAGAGVEARTDVVPATLEETMVLVERAGAEA